MTEEIIKHTVAGNISKYRKNKGLTQYELSEKINYSDKSISKWERGDGIPDVPTLVQLSEIFGVTVNDLIYDEQPVPSPKPTQNSHSTHSRFTWKHYFITLLSIVGTWFIGCLSICMLKFTAPDIYSAWVYPILFYSLTACCIVWLVFTVLWWPPAWKFLSITGIIWFATISIYITFSVDGLNIIFYIASILQIILSICYIWQCVAKHKILKLQMFPKN